MEEDEGLREIHQVLQCYFENDTRRRFQLEGPIASGADSIAWGVQQTTCGQACQRIVLKTPKWADLGGEEEEEAPDGDCNTWNNESNPPDPIENEKKWLGVLRWAKHVMNIVEIPDDPLNRRKSPLRRHGVENWMFLEWVQHGTLHRLVRRAKEENIEYLPNRMLWRFFMCQSAVVASGLGGGAHNLAVMIGPFEPNPEYPEHDITPVLEMIDLGKMSGNENLTCIHKHKGTNFDATKENIRDIGNVSQHLLQHPPESREDRNETGMLTACLALRPAHARTLHPPQPLGTQRPLRRQGDSRVSTPDTNKQYDNTDPDRSRGPAVAAAATLAHKGE
ncbi:hypothetical protein PG996_011732 [Apiospora saccharicola]|uniref:Uncharacterized protein n=1 Tax=Apiospora saccharicola TaxID=335842 RepID=A0ABR1UFV2_9PEZI